MIRSLRDWVLDQIFEVVGIIAEYRHRHARTRDAQQAYRQALLEAADAHNARIRCSRTDCPHRR